MLVTGATGFVGQGIIPVLRAAGYRVRAALRTPQPVPDGVESAILGDLTRMMNRRSAFEDVDFVVHCAGLAHATTTIPDETYRRVNTEATFELGRTAASVGVKRFVFLSSVRAQTGPVSREVVTEALMPSPTDAYGRSKLEAEQALAKSGVNHVVLRPVLVHGTGMRFNMAALLALAQTPWPLPFGLCRAKRSIVAREHLADAVLLALRNDAMAGHTYLVADPQPLGLNEMVAGMRAGFGRSPGLLPVPPAMLAVGARLAGRAEVIERLNGQLIADPAKLLAAGWKPRRGSRDALAETARAMSA